MPFGTLRAPESDHGEVRHYWRGCRCHLCKQANANYCASDRKTRGKSYVRKCNLRASYGLSLEEYEHKLKEQDGVCAACKQPEVGRNQYGPLPLAVDHDHKTGQLRGLLCMKCNRALGLLGDSVENLKQLIIYRERY